MSTEPATADALLREVVPRRSVRQHLASIWEYRELLGGLVKRALKVRYKNSVLGFLWSLLNPAMYLVVFTLVFQVFLDSNIPYFPIFLLSALLAWHLFLGSVPPATGSIVGNASLVKKVWFPREILPLADVGAAMVHFGLQLSVLVVAMAVIRYDVAWSWLWLVPIALAVLVLFASALSILLAAVNVRARDIQHLLELVLLAWFWMTPIVYPYTLISDKVDGRHLIPLLNPMTSITLTLQRAIWGREQGEGDAQILPADLGQLWYLRNLVIVGALAAVLLVVAIKVFDRLEGSFAEEI